jgi:hypothetical protein
MPSWPQLGQRILHGRKGIAITSFVFDVLLVEGHDTMCLPYVERRAILEALEFPRVARVLDSYEDGACRFEAVCRSGLEGVVAKPLDDPCRSGAARLDQDEEAFVLALSARGRRDGLKAHPTPAVSGRRRAVSPAAARSPLAGDDVRVGEPGAKAWARGVVAAAADERIWAAGGVRSAADDCGSVAAGRVA